MSACDKKRLAAFTKDPILLAREEVAGGCDDWTIDVEEEEEEAVVEVEMEDVEVELKANEEAEVEAEVEGLG